jgi:ribose transport system permease protein
MPNPKLAETNRWRPAAALLPYGLLLGLVILFWLATPSFGTWRNFTVIGSQAATLLIVCTGATFVVLMGSIDLSVGSIVLLVGAACVKLDNAFGLGWGTLLVALLLGLILGTFNGVAFSLGLVPSFVVTLGSLSIFSGIGLQLLQGRAISFESSNLDELAIGSILPGLQNIAVWALAVWLVGVLLARRTRFGRYIYLIGGGERVATNSGIPVRRYKVYAFMLSGLLCGLAGILAVVRSGAAGPTLGQELLLNSLAAIVVGGTSLSGGLGGPQRTLLGVLLISVLDDGLNLIGVSSYPQLVIKGAVVILAVLARRNQSKREIVK